MLRVCSIGVNSEVSLLDSPHHPILLLAVVLPQTGGALHPAEVQLVHSLEGGSETDLLFIAVLVDVGETILTGNVEVTNMIHLC